MAKCSYSVHTHMFLASGFSFTWYDFVLSDVHLAKCSYSVHAGLNLGVSFPCYHLAFSFPCYELLTSSLQTDASLEMLTLLVDR